MMEISYAVSLLVVAACAAGVAYAMLRPPRRKPKPRKQGPKMNSRDFCGQELKRAFNGFLKQYNKKHHMDSPEMWWEAFDKWRKIDYARRKSAEAGK